MWRANLPERTSHFASMLLSGLIQRTGIGERKSNAAKLRFFSSSLSKNLTRGCNGRILLPWAHGYTSHSFTPLVLVHSVGLLRAEVIYGLRETG